MSSRVNMRRGFWSRLSPRERNLIGLLAVVAFVMGTIMLFSMRATKFDEAEESIAEMRRGLELVYRQGSIYKEKLEERSSRQSKISSERLQFATMVDELKNSTFEEESTASLKNEEEKQAQVLDPDTGLTLRSYSFRLGSVTLDELLQFLEAVEKREEHIVLTDTLNVKSPSEVEDRLNADVTISTFQMVKAGPEAGAASEEESS